MLLPRAVPSKNLYLIEFNLVCNGVPRWQDDC
jgi:hypothetical protein